ncbi:MAG: prepilin-type N-terminal cleavage/methylation domain-containing protein [Caldisericia bacterium]
MKKGFTVIEIVITIIIVSIITVPFVLFFNSFIKNYHYGKPNQVVQNVVSDAIKEIAETLVQANKILTSESEKIEFNITIDGNLKKIVYELQNGFIIRSFGLEKRYVPYYNNPNTPDGEKVFLAISFKYFDELDNPITTPNPDKVYRIEISIKGEPYINPGNLPSLGLISSVRIRNK